MFPDLPDQTLTSVWRNCGGDFSAAVDEALTISSLDNFNAEGELKGGVALPSTVSLAGVTQMFVLAANTREQHRVCNRADFYTKQDCCVGSCCRIRVLCLLYQVICIYIYIYSSWSLSSAG